MLGAHPNFRQKVLEVPCSHGLAEASASSKSIAAITKRKTRRDKRDKARALSISLVNSHAVMNGRDRSDNTVYLWEQVSDPFDTGNNSCGLAFVAPTLFDFFYNLHQGSGSK
jgi:hypothetical protein